MSMVVTSSPTTPPRVPIRSSAAPADGRAYARGIAEKYGLTYDQLTEGSGA